MTLDLAYLDDFQVLAATGNFSRAAALRGMTQPAFSRRIRALEDWAGAPLFNRDNQPIGLTPAGVALQPSVTAALRSLLQGREDARAASARGRATLRFAATHALSFSFFPTWLNAMENAQEAVQLVSDSLSACEQLMRDGQAQFLLCHHHALAPIRLEPGRFRHTRIGGDTLCPVSAATTDGSVQHPLTGAGPVPYLSYSGESGLGRIVTAAATGLGLRLDTVFTSHLAAALRSTAVTGRGVAWLPLSLIGDDLAAGTLVRAGPAAMDIDMDIQLVRANGAMGVAAEAFWTRIGGAV
ncbi:LysR family transcriptional regulator [Acidisphaera sp. L21]|uniref:LysR family transcriptional regulator n=1 Tax=Acidisphaera sp. L21 TaxID=1641851 RepID=UPI0020B125D8|nr:LysR family transcriptional regulator [Acidisphaera sp. L21]